jgi:hypothetical protein
MTHTIMAHAVFAPRSGRETVHTAVLPDYNLKAGQPSQRPASQGGEWVKNSNHTPVTVQLYLDQSTSTGSFTFRQPAHNENGPFIRSTGFPSLSIVT